MRNLYAILVGKPERKSPLDRTKIGRKDTITMDPPDVRRETSGEDSCDLVQNPKAGSCKRGNEPSNPIKGGKCLTN
jgi:hypothetical protein